jgi:hypothetical protein
MINQNDNITRKALATMRENIALLSSSPLYLIFIIVLINIISIFSNNNLTKNENKNISFSLSFNLISL